MASRIGVVFVSTLLALGAAVAFAPRENPSQHGALLTVATAQKFTPSERPMDFKLPLYTKAFALVCPSSVALERREGYGLKAAVDAHLSVLGHQNLVAELGCEELREDLPVTLTLEGQQQAARWNNDKMCGMAVFTAGYIFTCDLKNSSNSQAVVDDAEKATDTALRDPNKVRLMECIGVNPWKVKPAGWTPPSEEECALIKNELDVENKQSGDATQDHTDIVNTAGGPPTL